MRCFVLVISQVQTQNLIKFHLKNIDQAPTLKSRHQQTSASQLNLKFKILSKPGFKISTKIQLHYLYKTSAAKYWPNSSFKSCLNFNFKILIKPCAQSLDKNLILWLNFSFPICTELSSTCFIASTSATHCVTRPKFWLLWRLYEDFWRLSFWPNFLTPILWPFFDHIFSYQYRDYLSQTPFLIQISSTTRPGRHTDSIIYLNNIFIIYLISYIWGNFS